MVLSQSKEIHHADNIVYRYRNESLHFGELLIKNFSVTAWTDFLGGNDGGEQGVRTLDTLPYTHFPSVRLRPLGQLSF